MQREKRTTKIQKTMFIKVNQSSMMFSPLFTIFHDEAEREKNFNRWQKENLPEFGQVLSQKSSYELYARVIGWQFKGEVDKKVWQPIKGYEDCYEPNRRTKAGKQMREAIADARGHIYNRLGFFDLFKTSIPVYGQSFTVPNGFVYNKSVYMHFDDRNYNDIKEKCLNQFEEITRGQYEEAFNHYVEELGDE